MTDSLKFIYKGFLQSVEIHIFCEPQSDGFYRAFCEAKLKLPILKKNYSTWTIFSTEDDQWQEHLPIREQDSEEKTQEHDQERIKEQVRETLKEKVSQNTPRNTQEKTVTKDSYSQEAVDPIGFFLKLHRREWVGDTVNLVIGAREVPLQLSREKNQIRVSRPEKNQSLVIKMGNEGIEALEIPIPVLGSLRVQRVF